MVDTICGHSCNVKISPSVGQHFEFKLSNLAFYLTVQFNNESVQCMHCRAL